MSAGRLNDEVAGLMSALCDGTLGAEGSERLDGLVTADATARRSYNNYMFLHAELFSLHASLVPVEDGRLQQRSVELGQRTLDGRVEIASGLPEGVELVDGPPTGFRLGRKVTIAVGRKPK